MHDSVIVLERSLQVDDANKGNVMVGYSKLYMYVTDPEKFNA